MTAGFWGFFAILMMIFLIHLFPFVTGAGESFALDMIDFLVAGIGFVLQMTISLFKNFLAIVD
jgi:hypothetical protein